MKTPSWFPNNLSIHVQRLTDGPGYVGMVFFFEQGMRHAVLHTRAYGATKRAAWDAAVEHVKTGTQSFL